MYSTATNICNVAPTDKVSRDPWNDSVRINILSNDGEMARKLFKKAKEARLTTTASVAESLESGIPADFTSSIPFRINNYDGFVFVWARKGAKTLQAIPVIYAAESPYSQMMLSVEQVNFGWIRLQSGLHLRIRRLGYHKSLIDEFEPLPVERPVKKGKNSKAARGRKSGAA